MTGTGGVGVERDIGVRPVGEAAKLAVKGCGCLGAGRSQSFGSRDA